MRALALVLVSLAALLAGPAHGGVSQASPSTPGEAVFLVSGRGWGHGVGMSQYGAYGMANEGASYARILSYFYTGIELGRAGRKEVRVLLAEGRRAVTVASSAPFSAVDATGKKVKLVAGPLVLTPELALPSPTGPLPARGPVVFRAGKAPLSLGGRPYRGKLEVAAQGSFIRVVNVVPVESYLQGVVAGEMPHTWPIEALKAQAVAARSYALANLVKGKPFDLYSDQRSQVYVGLSGEHPRTSEAVQDTVGQVVLYGGKIASTLYFSSSGGRTASAIDVFGTDIPYLVSRPDPWDKVSPFHRWGPVLLGARTVQSKLELPARVLDARGAPTPSGRLKAVTLQTAAGATSLPATLVRTSLGLRSTWFSIGVLRLDRPQVPVLYGDELHLSGIARGIQSPTLDQSLDGSTWSTVGALARSADGTASATVKPIQSTRYRIGVKGAASPALLARVAPRVTLTVAPEPDVLAGMVRPKLTGASVTIERKKGSVWTRVADAVVDSSGSFRASVLLVAASYRARVPATSGFAEGVAPTITVTG